MGTGIIVAEKMVAGTMAVEPMAVRTMVAGTMVADVEGVGDWSTCGGGAAVEKNNCGSYSTVAETRSRTCSRR